MYRLVESKHASTSTSGGLLTYDEDVSQSDQMYLYESVTEKTMLFGKSSIPMNEFGDRKSNIQTRDSLFPRVAPYVLFTFRQRKGAPASSDIEEHLIWRRGTRRLPRMIRSVVTASGFKISTQGDSWLGVWGPPMEGFQLASLKSFQKLNYFPGASELGHKDRLWINVRAMIDRFGIKEFGFVPETFVFPRDKKRFRRLLESHGGSWIAKPPTGSSGRGIRLVSTWRDVPNTPDLVVQRYLTKPRLIRGLKFDMRLYVLVTSIRPLLVYFYSEGLIRFATVEYLDEPRSVIPNRYMHLTNTTVNKSSPRFVPNDKVDQCKGHMWSLTSLWSYFGRNRRPVVSELRESINDLVIKTLVSVESSMTKSSDSSGSKCYQLFGFDVILDSRFKPWLLEVNNSPSMDTDTPLCSIVKGQLARDLLNLVGYQVPSFLSNTGKMNLGQKYELDSNSYDEGTLTTLEEDKQRRFANLEDRRDYLRDIIEDLTPDDLRHLVRYEDQLARTGRFEKIFPTRSTHVYHKFFDRLGYYNRLFDAWENIYGSNRSEGISRLQKLCESGVHLCSTPPPIAEEIVRRPD